MASSLSYEIIRGTLMATCTAVPNEFLQFLCWGQAVMFKLLLTACGSSIFACHPSLSLVSIK